MRPLGISAHYHDSAAAVVQDGKVIAATFTSRLEVAGMRASELDLSPSMPSPSSNSSACSTRCQGARVKPKQVPRELLHYVYLKGRPGEPAK